TEHSRGGTSPPGSRNPRPLGRGGCQSIDEYETSFCYQLGQVIQNHIYFSALHQKAFSIFVFNSQS
ncbi:MAG: hypothetical protein K2X65_03540, partial [Burkholderiaceae bacterium]|nr:hypothetical protein [Burkholderiaceae bacterium]